MLDMNMQEASQELRNTGLPLAISRPNFYIRAVLSGLLTSLVLFIFNYIFILKDSFRLPVCVISIILLLLFFNNKVDAFYIAWKERKWKDKLPTAVIGFSNKVLVLLGDDVIEEIETDEIEIKKLSIYEKQEYFLFTSVIYAKLNGKVVKKLYVDGINDYEGHVLNANPDRINEDIEIVYDDDDDENGEVGN